MARPSPAAQTEMDGALKLPPPGSKTGRIVRLLQEHPYASYEKIRKLYGRDRRGCYVSRAIINAIARKFGLRRGGPRYWKFPPEIEARLTELITTTTLTYAEIGRQVGNIHNAVVGRFARRNGIHNPNIRNRQRVVKIMQKAAYKSAHRRPFAIWTTKYTESRKGKIDENESRVFDLSPHPGGLAGALADLANHVPNLDADRPC